MMDHAIGNSLDSGDLPQIHKSKFEKITDEQERRFYRFQEAAKNREELEVQKSAKINQLEKKQGGVEKKLAKAMKDVEFTRDLKQAKLAEKLNKIKERKKYLDKDNLKKMEELGQRMKDRGILRSTTTPETLQSKKTLEPNRVMITEVDNQSDDGAQPLVVDTKAQRQSAMDAYGTKNKTRSNAGNQFFLQRNNALTAKGDMFGSTDDLIVEQKLHDIQKRQLKAEEKRQHNLAGRSASNVVANPLDQKISLVKQAHQEINEKKEFDMMAKVVVKHSDKEKRLLKMQRDKQADLEFYLDKKREK